jgi:hypothetical protein
MSGSRTTEELAKLRVGGVTREIRKCDSSKIVGRRCDGCVPRETISKHRVQQVERMRLPDDLPDLLRLSGPASR